MHGMQDVHGMRQFGERLRTALLRWLRSVRAPLSLSCVVSFNSSRSVSVAITCTAARHLSPQHRKATGGVSCAALNSASNGLDLRMFDLFLYDVTHLSSRLSIIVRQFVFLSRLFVTEYNQFFLLFFLQQEISCKRRNSRSNQSNSRAYVENVTIGRER